MLGFCFVPKVGVEPTLPYGNYALNVARLPIPPLRLRWWKYSTGAPLVNTKHTELHSTSYAVVHSHPYTDLSYTTQPYML